MADKVRMWEIADGGSLQEMASSRLDREDRLEKWIKQDVSVLEPAGAGLLIIGEQVETAYGKRIDLLCINADGNLVIVELKRDKTPREVTAQALDYASWVQGLDSKQIEETAAAFLGKSLRKAFDETFEGEEYPEVLNGDHSIKIVASDVDDSTERIIRYLSSNGIDINFVRFHLFQSPTGKELLVRTFTVPPDQAEQNVIQSGRTKRTSVRKTLEIRLAECTNPAEVAFLHSRLLDPSQAKDKNQHRLIYRVGGRVRFRLSPRATYARVLQRCRFVGDDSFWKEHLSNPEISIRDSGRALGFSLYSEEDFKFFQNTMQDELPKLQWKLNSKTDEESKDEEEDEA